MVSLLVPVVNETQILTNSCNSVVFDINWWWFSFFVLFMLVLTWMLLLLSCSSFDRSSPMATSLIQVKQFDLPVSVEQMFGLLVWRFMVSYLWVPHFSTYWNIFWSFIEKIVCSIIHSICRNIWRYILSKLIYPKPCRFDFWCWITVIRWYIALDTVIPHLPSGILSNALSICQSFVNVARLSEPNVLFIAAYWTAPSVWVIPFHPNASAKPFSIDLSNCILAYLSSSNFGFVCCYLSGNQEPFRMVRESFVNHSQSTMATDADDIAFNRELEIRLEHPT